MKIAYDKKLHFLAGLLIAFTVSYIMNDVRIGMLAATLAGLGKEIVDEGRYGGFDYQDIIATIIGGVAGIILFIAWMMRESLFGL